MLTLSNAIMVQMMKIDGPKKTDAANAKSKTSKSNATGNDSFKTLLDEGAQETSSAGQADQIASLDVLLAAQTVDDPADRKSRQNMVDRGDRILDQLEKIRLSLLTGRLTVGDLISMADVVASHREKISDPTLLAIIDEIDLRAQIEMAKMTRAVNQASPS
jgi:hypothetical protein